MMLKAYVFFPPQAIIQEVSFCHLSLGRYQAPEKLCEENPSLPHWPNGMGKWGNDQEDTGMCKVPGVEGNRKESRT